MRRMETLTTKTQGAQSFTKGWDNKDERLQSNWGLVAGVFPFQTTMCEVARAEQFLRRGRDEIDASLPV